jgi:hypothetical protein
LKKNEIKIFHLIIRETEGFHRHVAPMSLDYIAQKTLIERASVSRILTSLRCKGLIKGELAKGTKPFACKLICDPRRWSFWKELLKRQPSLIKSATLQSKFHNPSSSSLKKPFKDTFQKTETFFNSTSEQSNVNVSIALEREAAASKQKYKQEAVKTWESEPMAASRDLFTAKCPGRTSDHPNLSKAKIIASQWFEKNQVPCPPSAVWSNQWIPHLNFFLTTHSYNPILIEAEIASMAKATVFHGTAQ